MRPNADRAWRSRALMIGGCIGLATFNGARYLGGEGTIGTTAAGQQPDLVVLEGDRSRTIAALGRVDTVFRLGVGDPTALIISVTGRVGL